MLLLLKVIQSIQVNGVVSSDDIAVGEDPVMTTLKFHMKLEAAPPPFHVLLNY